MKKVYCLGLDTSNYTTSAALVDENLEVISESRQLLYVKPGEKGLRQSQALFEHMKNIPSVVERVMKARGTGQICAVCASVNPRPVEGSYMPVFRAGASYGQVAAAVLQAEFFETSHQEGHLAAVKVGSPFETDTEFLGLHLSGGTTEILRCRDLDGGFQTEIVGGTKDLSAGQLIDRIGVAMGLDFPCGKAMDEMVQRVLNTSEAGGFQRETEAAGKEKRNRSGDYFEGGRRGIEDFGTVNRKLLKKIHVDGGFMNLSGLETQALRLMEGEKAPFGAMFEEISVSLFYRLAEAFSSMIRWECERTGIRKVLVAGGVSSSKFLRGYLTDSLRTEVDIAFGESALSSDNAVGVARLGMKQYLKSRG